MHSLLSLVVVFFDPLCDVMFLNVSRTHDRRRIQRVLMSQVQVMGAIFYQHGNEAVGNVLSNPARCPRVQNSITEKEEIDKKIVMLKAGRCKLSYLKT